MPNKSQPSSTRREKQRAATRIEILDMARKQIAHAGAATLSLRAIAREMEVTAPALYRYFTNRDDLVTALIVDAFNSLADALQAACDARPTDDHAGRLRDIALAYREWTLNHPQDYALLFGAPIPGYHAPEEITLPAANRSMNVLVNALTAADDSGELDLPPEYAKPPAALQAQLSAWKKNYGYAAHPSMLYLALLCWSRMHGLVSLELNNQVQPMLGDAYQLYRAQVTELIRRVGLQIKN